jgi:hypothetical protein
MRQEGVERKRVRERGMEKEQRQKKVRGKRE